MLSGLVRAWALKPKLSQSKLNPKATSPVPSTKYYRGLSSKNGFLVYLILGLEMLYKVG